MEEIFFCPGCMAKAAPVDGKCPVCGCDVNTQNALHQLPVNTILNGRYIVGRVLGAGGFGITYIGYDLKLDGKVAIKEYYPSGAANRSMSLTVLPTTEVKGNPFEIGKDRFLKEAKTLSEFVGEGNIVALRDYFEENGTAYIVMEYLEGEDLSHYAKRHGVFALDEALDLLEPAMLALDKVHKKGLIHRDISPSNIMVLSDGRVKVLDFGSARLQNNNGELSLSVMLKPGYAPMEQYSTHGEQGSWTDVYAMSATVYKLITGKTPPPSTDRILNDTIERPSTLGVKITHEQEAALMRGLALRASDRTQTMAELAESLREKKASYPKPAKPPRTDKKEKPVKEQKEKKPPKPAKPAVDLKKKTATEKPAKPVKPAQENKKAEKPALPRKCLLIIAAALLAVLALCLTVPKAINSAGENNVEDVQDTHLAELAAAREAIAGHSETTISASYDFAAAVRTTGTVIIGVFDYFNSLIYYGEYDVNHWTDIVAVSAGLYHTVGLKADGTVVAAGSNENGRCDVDDWTDMVAISAGGNHTVGLKADGTVVAIGNNRSGQCNVGDWTGIVAVSAGSGYTVGLKSDGTVVAVGADSYGQCNVSDWADIVAVSAGMYHTVGLKLDGNVVAAGSGSDGKCSVSGWTDIVAVSAGGSNTVGLKADGTVVAVGNNGNGQCDVYDWQGVVAVSAGIGHTVGLKADGSVVALGSDYYKYGQYDISDWTDIMLPGSAGNDSGSNQDSATTQVSSAAISMSSEHAVALKADGTVVILGPNYYGQCDVSDWTDIVAVSKGEDHTVGLKADGTVVAVGKNDDGQCDVSAWTDIIAISAGDDHTVGLKADGTVIAVGGNYYTRQHCDVLGWTDIVAVGAGYCYTLGLKSDGTVVAAGPDWQTSKCDIGGWTDIIAISVGASHVVGLKADGTVVAAGSDSYGQCSVQDWTDIVAISAGGFQTAGLKADGTVVSAGGGVYYSSKEGDISGWADIVAVSSGKSRTMGLKSDGTVVVNDPLYDVSSWTDIALPE